MQPKWKESALQGGLAWLLSLGLTLTLLGVTGLIRHGWLAALTLLGVCGAAAALSPMGKRARLAAYCAGGFVGLLWLLLGGGAMVGEVIQALIWHLSGLPAALPLVGAPFAVVVSLLCGALAWFVTQRSAGPYPALLLMLMAALLLWLGNRPGELYALLPAVLACVTLLLRAGDDETSTTQVLPMAAVITLLCTAGLVIGGVTWEPLRDLAQELRQRIYDTLFYTAPRDVFTLASEGWYPQGQKQLGGPAEPHTEPVMVVLTPRKTYLRGVVKDVYTGRTWEDSVAGRRYLWSASRYEELRQTTFDQLLPDSGKGSELMQSSAVTVRMLGGSASTLFVPQRVRSLTAEGNLIPYYNQASEIFATRNLEIGDVWTADAPLFTSMDAGLDALIRLNEGAADPNWEAVCETYLQLPEHLESHVYEIAARATQGAQTPYEKAMALQRYLSSNYTYTLDVAEQSPEMDFVSTFLLLTQEGYCTYFASAMTVLCRMQGLPARYVEGYVATPDGEGKAIVTGEQGHAWTEVYFRGFGWVTFDATPISAESLSLPEDAMNDSADASDEPEPTPEPTAEQTSEPTAEPTAEPTPQPTATPSPTANPDDAPSPQAPESTPAPAAQDAAPLVTAEQLRTALPWLLAALVVLRIVMVQPAVRAWRQRKRFGKWMAWAQAMHDALRMNGFARQESEPIGAFFARLREMAEYPEAVMRMEHAENLMFYGHADPFQQDVDQARAAFAAAYGELVWWRKAAFHLERIVLPRRLHDFSRG